jgi:hypothetical protein
MVALALERLNGRRAQAAASPAATRARLHTYLANPAHRLAAENDGLVEAILDSISLSVSIGNGRVFAELAHPFHQFAAELGRDTLYSERRLQRFLAQFRPGPVEAGGQDGLIEAFTAYYQARFTTEPAPKAQMIFLANLLVGLHEQIRLQPHIAEALEAPAATVHAHFPGWLGEPAASSPQVWHALYRLGQQVLTRTMLFITTPAGDLRLGQNVRPPLGHTKFPDPLVKIENERLRQLLQAWDWSNDTLTGTAAVNWASLADRMHFIADLFRSHQQSDQLLLPPFLPAQARLIRDGRIPAGVL